MSVITGVSLRECVSVMWWAAAAVGCMNMEDSSPA